MTNRSRARGHGLDLLALEWIRIAARLGSFRKAAERLGVSQAAVSRRINSLEDGLGISLFDRQSWGVSLTPAGEAFLAAAASATSILDAAVAGARDAGSGRIGKLRIGLGISFVGKAVGALLLRYVTNHPRIHVEIIEGAAEDHFAAICDRHLDIAILPSGATITGIDVAELSREPIMAAIPDRHPLASHDRLDGRCLRGVPILIGGKDLDDPSLRRLREELQIDAAAHTVRVLDVSTSMVLDLVRLGLGVGLVRSNPTQGCGYGLTYRPLGLESATTSVSAMWSSKNGNPALRRFISEARNLTTRPVMTIEATTSGAVSPHTA